MYGVSQLKKQLVEYTSALFEEGFLDDQFIQLQQLQDESNPEFVVEVVTLFFEDAERLLNELTKSLGQENIDFKRLDAHVHQLKGSSSSITITCTNDGKLGVLVFLLTLVIAVFICFTTLTVAWFGIGAQRVQKVCIAFRNYCEGKNVEGCLKSLQEIRQEYSLVKSKFETLFKMEQQLFAAGGSVSR